jgi:hypothetical protein
MAFSWGIVDWVAVHDGEPLDLRQKVQAPVVAVAVASQGVDGDLIPKVAQTQYSGKHTLVGVYSNHTDLFAAGHLTEHGVHL